MCTRAEISRKGPGLPSGSKSPGNGRKMPRAADLGVFTQTGSPDAHLSSECGLAPCWTEAPLSPCCPQAPGITSRNPEDSHS